MRVRHVAAALGGALALAAATPARPSAARSQGTQAVIGPAASAVVAERIRQVFDKAYALEYADALALARRTAAEFPNESAAHRADAAMAWLEILFRRGTVTTDHYLRGLGESQAGMPPIPSDLEAEFQRESARATALAAARVGREPGNLDAIADAAACYALEATYAASIKGSATAAFGPARRAYDAADTVFEKDATRASTAFIVGTYRYAISTLWLPTRLFAYLAGFDGDKDRGIAILENALLAGGDGHVEAGVSLILIYAREGRHADALRVARQLAAEFPRNRLLALEAGSAAVRAGRGAEGDRILTAGLAALAADPRPRFPGEQAYWLYKRGIARLEQNRLSEAAADFDATLAAEPVTWMAGRTYLQLGKIADLENRRPDAVRQYGQARQLCRSDHDPCETEANQLLSRPFRVKGDAGSRNPGGTFPPGSSLK